MSSGPIVAPVSRDGTASGFSAMPGVRVFDSGRFRLAVAAIAAVCGVLLNLALLLALEQGGPLPWLVDFEAYHQAAQRLAEGQATFEPAQLAGPVDAVCDGCYLYPPFLAQLTLPLAGLPLDAAKGIWLVAMSLTALASTWLATGIGGASRSLERLLWCVAATSLFMPVFHGNWFGNVSSLLALGSTLVALGGAAAGIGAALVVLVKLVPGTLVPAVLVAGRESRWWFVGAFAVMAGVSFVFAPTDWLDYPTVFVNMLAGTSDYPANLAVANAAVQLGLPDVVAASLRVSTFVLGGAAIVLSAWLARRPDGMPAAALAGTVALLVLPATIWYHYFAVLLPFAAMAWPGARAALRVGLLVGAAIVVVAALGYHYVPIWVGTTAMVVCAGWVLWPRSLDRRP